MMFLTDVRTLFQLRLTTLFRRSSKKELSLTPSSNERWLTQRQAAQILQPHMPHRDALAWLELDRNVDPSLPFVVARQGEIIYRFADVKAFVRRMPRNLAEGGATYSVVSESPDRR